MKAISSLHTGVSHALNRLMPLSLRVQLTVGVTAVSVLGIGSVAGWTSWRMQQILVEGRKENITQLAKRVVQEASLYSEMMSVDMALQKAIDNRTTGNLVLWVVSADPSLNARSDTLSTVAWQRDQMAARLFELPETARLPSVYAIGDRYLVICGGPVTFSGQQVGWLYIAEDITRDQTSLLMVLRTLGLASVFGSLLIAVVLAFYVWRSLQPLRQLSQQTGTVSAKNLGQAQIQVPQAPAEVRELEQAFNRMLSRLGTAWSQQQQFVSNVSHELRTPLTLVHGYLQSTLRRSQNLTAPQREGLEIAAAETDRTIRLLQDLLDLARADSGYLRLHIEAVSLKDFSLDLLSTTPGFSDRIVLEVESYPLVIQTDRERLKQIVINLLENAVKYSDPHQPIRFRLWQEADHVILQVCDRGKGIAPHHLVHLFEPFYRVDEDRSRATGGTGLGLSIVKTLVTRLGGSITVQSAVGEGSQFTVTLPMQSK